MDLTLTGEINSTRIVNKYSPSLELVQSASSGRNKDGDWAVWLSFTKGIYQFNEVYAQGRLVQKDEEKTNSVAIFTGDEELANRAASAFNHLIKLCGGGRKEPF